MCSNLIFTSCCYLLWFSFVFISVPLKQCVGGLIMKPKGACGVVPHDMMDPLRMEAPDIFATEFDTNFGFPFDNYAFGGFRYRFISKSKVNCYNIEGDIPKYIDKEAESQVPLNNVYGYMTQIHGNLEPERMLVCHDCKIERLTANTTDKVISKSKFMYFDFAGAEMTEIDSNAFESFPQLSALNFDDNSLASLPVELFDNIQMISALQLSFQSNNFRRISRSLCNVKEMEFLNLQNNKIDTMDLDCYLKVVNLNMSRNSITQLNLNWLEDLDKLTLLDLSFNDLHTIISVESSNLDSLKYLFLNDNKLSEIGRRYFRRLTNLLSLYLSRNGISAIDSEAFKDLKKLANLDLSQNNIADIPFGIFRDLETLKELNLAGNKLSKLTMQTFAGLTELKYLNLSSNLIRQISSTDLLQIKQLQALDLSNNKLQKLDAKAILSHHSLSWLAIKDNFWNCRQLVQILQVTKAQNCNVKRGVLFDVPNIHGVACSTKNLTLRQTLDFESFLSNLSDEKEMELILAKLDAVPTDDDKPSDLDLVVYKIKSLLLVIVVLFVVDFIFQWLFRLYQARHTVNIPISNLK